ncbi:MAG: cation-translocating P-type ATPase family protein [Planctomycetes bacterium]|nr:cation-translocating P-type ATPase family protein [Planctomycetota bacterium]
MHREISHDDSGLAPPGNVPLYVMTGLLGLLIALDVLPRLLGWSLSAGAYRFALIAAVLGGARILYGSLQSLIEGRLGADLALAIACIAAILINEPLVAAEVVFIGMVGECLEAFTFARTKKALTKIVEVFPRRCWRLEDGKEVRVLTSQLQVGDRVVVKPGGKIPVDAIVLDGTSAVDTSALTGESLPVDKRAGDEVLAGSINQFGALTLEARQVALETVAGKVIELTTKALKDKAPVERTADRLARYFLPVVLGLAALTLIGGLIYYGTGLFRSADLPRLSFSSALTRSIYPTLSVLVVACPCALILATPAAIIAALGRLAGTGILIKSGAALERLAGVTAFAFDKTGTITEGRLELGDVLPLGDLSADELLRLAASAEQPSEHPLARVILGEAASRNLALRAATSFQAHPGAGIRASLAEGNVLVGTRRLLEEQRIDLPPEVEPLLARLDAAGQTVLLVARDGQVLGVIGARDRVRPEAAGVLAELRYLGIDPIVLLTGDRAAASNALAADLPFSAIHAELLPEQKASLIDELKTERKVAMLGDGINDAPALVRADVGLAVGGAGTDIAAEAGDVVFMGDPLRPLPLLLRLSRETVRIINQNILWFAFVVNAVGIVVTAWLWPLFAPAGWLEQSPLAAVLYHQVGSLAVLLNSMRLLWFERPLKSPRIAGFKAWWRQTDLWFEKNLDLGEIVHRLEHHWRRLLIAAGAVLIAIIAISGLTIVRADESGVVRRFGAAVDDLGPGWHLRWPWPIEDVVRVSRNVRTVELGYREKGESAMADAMVWEHKKDSRFEDESMMITGDGNLVDIQAAVFFRITQPRVYLFEVQGVEDILRARAEATLRTLVGGRAFQDLLTIERRRLQDDVLQILKESCGAYGKHGLGVGIEDVAILSLHPPADVVGAYYEVAKAVEAREQRRNEAEKSALLLLKQAEADGNRIVSAAKAAYTEKLSEAAGDRDRFLARSKVRGQDAPLSDFRIFWDGVSKALAGRDMVLIDADKIHGQRNLMLFDPDVFRPPPVILPPRGIPKGPIEEP